MARQQQGTGASESVGPRPDRQCCKARVLCARRTELRCGRTIPRGIEIVTPSPGLSEDAPPVDIVSTHGEAAASAGPAAGSASTAANDGDGSGRDGLTLAIAIAAATLAAAALGLQLIRRR